MQAAKDRREAEMQLAKSLSSPKYFAETIRQGLLSPEVPMPPRRPPPLPPRRAEGLLSDDVPIPPQRPQKLFNMEEVQSILNSKFSPQVTAALMGNIAVESDYTFDYTKKQNDGGRGRGLFQMEKNRGMFNAYNKYLNKNDIQDSAQAQIDFMENILSSADLYDIGAGHRRAMKKAFESGNIPRITREFSERVLRPGIPHMDSRLEQAKKYTPRDLK
jgi:hypothetical protein